jgi:hypothetical protein
VPGSGVGRAGLLGRSRRLARASAGVVAFLWGAPRGSGFTVGEAIRPGKPAAVVLAGGGAELPSFPGGTWVPCSIGSVAAFRWVPGPEGEHPTRKTWLAGVFQVPEGEPTHALLTHISSLSQGDRLWFERGIVGGDTVLVPHEALSDTPALLAIPRLTRRFRCTVREASGLAELFLALDASPAVVAHYEAEARCRRIASIVDDLVHPVAGLALVEQGPDTDALEDAECLGDGAEWVTEDGQVAQRGVQPEEDGAHRAWQTVAWHALGTVQPERVACPVCRAVFEADDDTPEIPTCPECGTRDTWEARQAVPWPDRRDRPLPVARGAGRPRQAALRAPAVARPGRCHLVPLPPSQAGAGPPRRGRACQPALPAPAGCLPVSGSADHGYPGVGPGVVADLAGLPVAEAGGDRPAERR